MAYAAVKEVLGVSIAVICYFVSVLTADDNSLGDQNKSIEFYVMPGGQVHVQEETLDGVTCTFTYACQGGTKEMWKFEISRTADLHQYTCNVERPGFNSYLYFLNFKLEMSGATVSVGEAFGNGVKALLAEEYKLDTETDLIMSQDKKFKNELSKVVLEGRRGKIEL